MLTLICPYRGPTAVRACECPALLQAPSRTVIAWYAWKYGGEDGLFRLLSEPTRQSRSDESAWWLPYVTLSYTCLFAAYEPRSNSSHKNSAEHLASADDHEYQLSLLNFESRSYFFLGLEGAKIISMLCPSREGICSTMATSARSSAMAFKSFSAISG